MATKRFVYRQEGIEHVERDVVRFFWRGKTIDLRTVDSETAMQIAQDPRCTVLREAKKKASKPKKPEPPDSE